LSLKEVAWQQKITVSNFQLHGPGPATLIYLQHNLVASDFADIRWKQNSLTRPNEAEITKI
jgi:hypothetical protein